jgi:hypothetical protein
VSNDDGGVPFVLPSVTGQPAVAWIQPAPESSLLATVQLAAGALRLGLDHSWVARAVAYCWARVGDVTPADAYTFTYVVDFLDVVPDRARAAQELDRLATLVPADGRIVAEGGIEGEELGPLAVAPSPEHAGSRFLDPVRLEHALDALEAGQLADGGWDVSWEKWNPAVARGWTRPRRWTKNGSWPWVGSSSSTAGMRPPSRTSGRRPSSTRSKTPVR